jgi:hypothetical protein
MELFQRETEDTELRIAAYLAVMKCPSDWVIGQVREALTAETVNQVSYTSMLTHTHTLTLSGLFCTAQFARTVVYVYKCS